MDRSQNALGKRIGLLGMMQDNARPGSVGAPGGLLGMNALRQQPRTNMLANALTVGSFAPGIGDALGFLGDARMYAQDPSSRTMPNYLMSAAGATLPFFPGAASLKLIPGEKKPMDTDSSFLDALKNMETPEQAALHQKTAREATLVSNLSPQKSAPFMASKNISNILAALTHYKNGELGSGKLTTVISNNFPKHEYMKHAEDSGDTMDSYDGLFESLRSAIPDHHMVKIGNSFTQMNKFPLTIDQIKAHDPSAIDSIIDAFRKNPSLLLRELQGANSEITKRIDSDWNSITPP